MHTSCMYTDQRYYRNWGAFIEHRLVGLQDCLKHQNRYRYSYIEELEALVNLVPCHKIIVATFLRATGLLYQKGGFSGQCSLVHTCYVMCF